MKKKVFLSLVILASGFGRRFEGTNKLLQDFQGKPMYWHALYKACSSRADAVSIVTTQEEIASCVKAEFPKIQVIWNEHPERGISESIHLGLQAVRMMQEEEYCNRQAEEKQNKQMEEQQISGEPTYGCGFLVCDQPMLEAKTLQKLCESFRRAPNYIHALCNEESPDQIGNPCIFPECYFEELMGLEGDQGGKRIVNGHLEQVKKIFAFSKELVDIDTLEDYNRLNFSKAATR